MPLKKIQRREGNVANHKTFQKIMNNKDYAEFYTGTTLINVRVEQARTGPMITAYVNGISLRASSLTLANKPILELFVQSISAAACGSLSEITAKSVNDFIIEVTSKDQS
jgi:hypothetical protein